MSEEWRKIKGTHGRYYVSSNGEVLSIRCDRKGNYSFNTIKPQKYSNGYMFVSLSVDGKTKQRLLHRLVMETFVGESNLEVNHKNGDKNNNNLSNLEYVTHASNILHSFRVLKRNPVKSWLGKSGFLHNKSYHIILTNKDTGETLTFGSLREAERKGFDRTKLASCLKEKTLYKNIYKVERYEDSN